MASTHLPIQEEEKGRAHAVGQIGGTKKRQNDGFPSKNNNPLRSFFNSKNESCSKELRKKENVGEFRFSGSVLKHDAQI